ncbi:MAG: exopolysaccharide biosynthesis protein [Caulobacter sp.]|nr:exopolysaccharide biosynthesis protein [Caulobacter sp.]
MPAQFSIEDDVRSLSQVIGDIADDAAPAVTVGEIVERLGERAFGALLFVFAAPNWLPMPPGASTVLGTPLVLLSPQMAVGVQAPWLPRFVTRRALRRADMARAYRRLHPWLLRLETFSRPRLGFLFGPVGDRLIGLVCFLLSVVLILPIPLGNLAPAAAIALFGLAMIQRDGLLALIALAIAVASVALLVLGGHAALLVAQRIIGSLQALFAARSGAATL